MRDAAAFTIPSVPDFQRVPGLYRLWEISQLLEAGQTYHLEDAGKTSDGAALFAVYRWLPTRMPDEHLQ